MFTGIVQAVGEVSRIEPCGGDLRLRIDTRGLPLAGLARGDSIAVNGVCLTATDVESCGFVADVSRETLALTTVGDWSVGTPVNLERALRAGDALGGHFVSGHVDGTARVVTRHDDARSVRIEFELPASLARYVARKGSICIDGVSLTVNGVSGRRFDVNLVPHTLAVTVLTEYRAGTRVNVEVDLVARYLERLAGPLWRAAAP